MNAISKEQKARHIEAESSESSLTQCGAARLDWALSAARLGIPVVPLGRGTKVGVNSWPEMATTDESTIVHWIIDEYPDCNFGLVMGNGWICLDLDRHEASKDGIAKLATLCSEKFDTFCVETPGDGVHYYFRTPQRNYKRYLEGNDGIDVLGKGGYVVAPFSTLDDGKFYKPLSEWNEICDIPERLIDALPERFIECSSTPPPAETLGAASDSFALATDFIGDPLSPDERIQLQRRLSAIDPDLPYEWWYRVIFAVLNVWKARGETVDCLMQWSRTSNKWNQNEFDKKVASYLPDVERELGLSYLARTANHFPVASVSRTLTVPVDTEEEVERLALLHLNTTQHLLRSFGSVPSIEHARALGSASQVMLRGLFSSEDFRFALPLETGMGKTTSVISLCSVISSERLDKAVLICCERVEQLAELRTSLVAVGVAETDIGLIHSSQAYKASVAAISIDRSANFQFLLACHQKVRLESVREYPERLMQYKGRRRDLVIWDESLISSSGFYIGRREMVESIAMWHGRHALSVASGSKPRPGFNEIYRSVGEFLTGAQEAILATSDGVANVGRLDLRASQAKQAIGNILGERTSDDQAHARNLVQLVEYAERGEIRVVRISGDYALLQFQQTIDAAFNKIVVLDASCRIRDLAQYDPKLEIQSLPITKRYSNVEVRWVPARASKSSFVDPETGEGHFQSFITHLSARMKDAYDHNCPGMIFCHLENKERVKEAVERCKAASAWGLAPIHVLHWGEHRATNRYKDCRWTFFWGVQYLPRQAIAAQIIGQTGRIDYPFMDREIDDVLESEVAEGIYQAISRGASRNVIAGEAGHQVVDLVLPENHARNVLPLLAQVMPGIRISETRPDYFRERQRKNALDYRELAGMKREYLMNLPGEVSEVSKREVNKHFGVSGNDSLNRNADRYLSNLLLGWIVHDRSFLRAY